MHCYTAYEHRMEPSRIHALQLLNYALQPLFPPGTETLSEKGILNYVYPLVNRCWPTVLFHESV